MHVNNEYLYITEIKAILSLVPTPHKLSDGPFSNSSSIKPANSDQNMIRFSFLKK